MTAEKVGKAVNFTYEESLKLVALTMQVSHGKYDSKTAPPVGALDMIGKDRQYGILQAILYVFLNEILKLCISNEFFRVAWQALGDKSKCDCMFEFIFTLDKKCPLFKPYVEAHRTAVKAQSENVNGANSKPNNLTDEENELQETLRKAEEAKEKSEEQKRGIQDALNSQTFSQFKSYAEQQFPGNPEQVRYKLIYFTLVATIGFKSPCFVSHFSKQF